MTRHQPFHLGTGINGLCGRLLSAVLCVVLMLQWGLFDSAAAPSDKTRSIVAAMITKIHAYTRWPATDRMLGDETIAVYSKEPAALATFMESVDNQMSGGIRWHVQWVNNEVEAGQYRFVFMDSTVPPLDHDWYRKYGAEGIVTFSEQPDRGCIFTFVISDGRVRFDVDLSLAASANISFDPRLVGLARHVRQKGD